MASSWNSKVRKIALFSKKGNELVSDASVFKLHPGGRKQLPHQQQQLEREEEGALPGPAQQTKEPLCLSCQVQFSSREEQVEHYKLDWHRYNLKRRLKGLEGVDQDHFEKIAGEQCVAKSMMGFSILSLEECNLCGGPLMMYNPIH